MQTFTLRSGIIMLFLIAASSASSQDSTRLHVKLNVGADIVSRYIWRGCDYGNSPAVQPTLSLTAGNFEAGVWGSVAMFSFYKEVDLYAKYSLKGFSVSFTDYYIPSTNGTPASPDTRY
ncbi:MAG: TorF family putative porin, partial [Syntrophothermus sp.]